MLAQLHTSNSFKPARSLLWRYLPILSAILGLYLMSFPSEYSQDAAWSRVLADLGRKIIPGHGELARFWPGIGAQMLCASIMLSPELKNLLSGRVLAYLGSASFSLYLLHGTLMRTVLAWMTFGPAILSGRALVQPSQFYPQPSNGWFFFILPAFFTFMMSAVHIWSVKVEPIFARATKKLEQLVTGGKEIRKSPIMYPADTTGNKRKESKGVNHARGYSNGTLEQQVLHGNGHVRKQSKEGNGFVYGMG
jgi:hypothetical protein